jgi:hypothetical protein
MCIFRIFYFYSPHWSIYPLGLCGKQHSNGFAFMAVVKNHTSKWLSLPLIVLTIFVTGLVFLILLGALLPAIPMLGAIGTAVISFFTLHMVVAALLATLLSYVSMRVTPYRAAKVCLILGVVSFISAWIPVIAFVNAASDYDADISWSTHWSAFAPEDMLGPDETHVYAAPEGDDAWRWLDSRRTELWTQLGSVDDAKGLYRI